MKESHEFICLQKELLRHKKLYYVDNNPELSDYDFDMLERKSYAMAKGLGFNADRFEEPEYNESHHVHWMVGYDDKSVYNK